jgi:ribosomal protein S4
MAKKSKKKKASKAKKKAEKQIKKYYGEKEQSAKDKEATDRKRLGEDLDRVLADAGITKTRAMEDYTRNMENIANNKAADVADIDTYVNTQKGRTTEDLTTSLAKESRRYAIEYDKTNQDLADTGMTFSERTPEKIIQAENVQNVDDVETAAQRSFQDIANYEASKRRNVELTYGQQMQEQETSKTRTIEDIASDIEKAQVAAGRTGEDLTTGLTEDLRDLGYQKSDSISGVGNAYDSQINTINNV